LLKNEQYHWGFLVQGEGLSFPGKPHRNSSFVQPLSAKSQRVVNLGSPSTGWKDNGQTTGRAFSKLELQGGHERGEILEEVGLHRPKGLLGYAWEWATNEVEVNNGGR